MFCAGKRTRLAFTIFAVKLRCFGAGRGGTVPELKKVSRSQVFLTFVVWRN